jgi:Tol biopolymer transport system component
MPDGRALLLDGADDKGARGALKLDLRTGTTDVVVSGTSAATISHDGKTLYYVPAKGPDNRLGQAIVARDIASGKERLVYSASGNQRISVAYSRYEPNLLLTRDGSSIVFALRPSPDSSAAQVLSVPVQGGSARVVAAPPPDWNFTNVRFVGQLSNGDVVFTTYRDLHGGSLERASAWRVNLDSGRYTQLEMPRSSGPNGERCECSLSISPDGRRVAFTDGQSTEELWAFGLPAEYRPTPSGR